MSVRVLAIASFQSDAERVYAVRLTNAWDVRKAIESVGAMPCREHIESFALPIARDSQCHLAPEIDISVQAPVE
jgi:hypothetical protein